MEFSLQKIMNFLCVSIDEELEISETRIKLNLLLQKLMITEGKNIVFKLKSGVVLGAHFLGALILTALEMREKGGTIAIICGDEGQEDFLKKMKIETLLNVYNNEAIFISAFNKIDNNRATILCIDDEKAALNALKRTLYDQPYRILTALSGEEAKKKAENEAPDIALVDIMMPGMDGFKVVKMLKRIRPEIKIIIVTALNDDSTLFHSIRMQCDGFLEKPWQPSWLTNQIESILARRKCGGTCHVALNAL